MKPIKWTYDRKGLDEDGTPTYTSHLEAGCVWTIYKTKDQKRPFSLTGDFNRHIGNFKRLSSAKKVAELMRMG